MSKIEQNIIIRAKDDFTSTMKAIAKSNDDFVNSLHRASKHSFSPLVNQLQQVSNQTANVSLGFSNLYGTLYKVSAAYSTFANLSNITDTLLSGAYTYTKELETNVIGISGILTSMTNVNGRQMEWNESLALSRDIMKDLRIEAMQTAATSESLVETFRALLGPGMAAGLNIDQIKKLTTVGVNAVTSLGLPKNQYVQELRSILQGNIRPASSTLATALGITNQEVKAAEKSADGLYKYLMDRMNGFEQAVKATQGTVAGRSAIIEETIKGGMSNAFKSSYEAYNSVLGEIIDKITVFDKKANKMMINPELEKSFESLNKLTESFASGLKSIATDIPKMFAFLGKATSVFSNNIGSLSMLFLGKALTVGYAKTMSNLIAFWKNVRGISYSYQKLTEASEEFNKTLEVFGKQSREIQEADKYAKELMEDVHRLASYYKECGISAEESYAMANSVHAAYASGDAKLVITLKERYKYYAEINKKKQEEIEKQQRIIQLTQEYKNANYEAMLSAGKDANSEYKSALAKATALGAGRSEESILRFAERLQKLGVDRVEALKKQQELIELANNGEYKKLAAQKQAVENTAIEALKKADIVKEQKEQYLALCKTLEKQKESIKLGTTPVNAAEKKYLNFLKNNSTVDDGKGGQVLRYSQEQKQLAIDLQASLQRASLTAEEAYNITAKYLNMLAKGESKTAEEWAKQTIAMENTIRLERESIANRQRMNEIQHKWNNVDVQSLSATNWNTLVADYKLILSYRDKEEVSVKRIKQAQMDLQKELLAGAITYEQYQGVIASLMKQVATGYVEIAGEQSVVISNLIKEGQLAGENAVKLVEAEMQKVKAEADTNLRIKEALSSTEKLLQAENQRVTLAKAQELAITAGKEKEFDVIQKLVQEVNKLHNSDKKGTEEVIKIEEVLLELLKKILETEGQITEAMTKQAEASLKAAEAANKSSSMFGRYWGTATKLSGALTSCAFATQMFVDDSDSLVGMASDWVIKIGFMVSAADSLANALEGVGLKAIFAKTMLLGIPFAIAAGAGYLKYKEYQKGGLGAIADEETQAALDQVAKDIETALPGLKDDNISKRAAEEAERAANDMKRRKAQEALRNAKITNRFDSNVGDDKAARKAAKEEEKRQENIRKSEEAYTSLYDTIKVANTALNPSLTEYEKQTKENIKKTNKWKATLIDAVVKSGGAYNTVTEQVTNYGNIGEKRYNKLNNMIKENIDLTNQKISLAEKEKQISNNLQSVSNMATVGGYSQEELYKLRKQYLQDEQILLYEKKRIYAGNAVEIANIEQQLANNIKAIRDNDMYDMKTAWRAALQEMSTQQINYGETIKSTFSSIESAGVSLLNSTESFGSRIKTFFSDIASSIMQEMSKLIMKALITNVLLKAFSGLGGAKIGGTTFANTGIGESNYFTGLDFHAKGGYASGWSIVGEQGPELVNFSNPARVYTAQQTANALGGNSNVNIKIDLKNESGQQLEAETTGSSFDGENYIVGVVLKAINNNKYGMRTTLKGLANT